MRSSSARRGEKHDTEEPVERIGAEAGAVDAEHARFAEQPEDEIFVRLAGRKHDPGHGVEGSRRRDHGHAVDGVQATRRQLRALAKRGTKRRLVRAIADRALRRWRAPSVPCCTVVPSASFLIPASTSSSRGGVRGRQPSGAPARRQVRLRQRREGDDRRVRAKAGDRRYHAVERRGRRRPRRRAGESCGGRRSPREPGALQRDTSPRSDCSDR